MAVPSGKPKFAYYTRSKFNALSAKDISTFYVVEETDGKRRIYLGEYLLTEGYLTAHQSLSNYVTTNTTQTISGVKTFSGATTTGKRFIATGSNTSTHGVVSRGSRANMLYDNVGVTGGLASALVDVDITNGNNQTTRVAKIGIYGSGAGGTDGAPSATYLWISSVLGNTYNVSPTLKIDSQDRVGVAIAGSGRPTQALDVAGKIRMRTQTAANDGADIVTTKKYVDDKISNIELIPGPKGDTGATFIPEVSSNGLISWTNDKGLQNPTARDIKGPKGDPGTPGAAAGFGTPTASVTNNATGTPTVSITATGSNTAKVFDFKFSNLKGAQGNPGANGTDGTNGKNLEFAWDSPNYRLGVRQQGDSTYTYSGPLRGATGAKGADGKDLTFNWSGYTLGVRTGTTGNYTYSQSLRGATGANGTNGKNLEFAWDSPNYRLGVRQQGDSTYTYSGPLRGATGINGKGWTSGSYNSSTGIVTFSSTDGLGFSTGNLKGANGTNGTNGKNLEFAWDSPNYRLGVRQQGDSTYTYSGPLRGATGANGTNGTNGVDGARGYSYRFINSSLTTSSTQVAKAKVSDYATVQWGDIGIDKNGYLFKITGEASLSFTISYQSTRITGAKGDTGAKGADGAAAGFGTPTASVTNNATGTPTVSITATGSNTAKIFDFKFSNLKGAKGDPGKDGLTTKINVNGETYTQSSGTITLPNYPSIPTIPSIITPTEGNAGISETQRTINAKNLKDIILHHAADSIHTHDYKNITGLTANKVLGRTTGGTGEVEALDMVDINDLGLGTGTSWTQVWSGSSTNLNSYTDGWYQATVPFNSYSGKRIAIEVQYIGHTSKIIFGVLGSSRITAASASISRGIGWSYFDGTNLRVKTLYAYTPAGTSTAIYVGYLKSLLGSFSGTTIEWSTSYSEALYMKNIWVIE